LQLLSKGLTYEDMIENKNNYRYYPCS
jgi:hypothetical protein